MSKKVIVTGGAGFIGSHIVNALVERGDETHVVDNYATGKHEDRFNQNATYHELDILETSTLQKIFESADVVFHAAARPRVPYSIDHPVETTEVNITGTVSVLAAAVSAKVRRLVYSGSSSVYGIQNKMPLTETMSPDPIHPYGLQKYVGELFVRMWPGIYGIETVTLRYFNVYGPGLDPYGPYALAIGQFLMARKEGRPITIYGDGTITRDFTHVNDIVKANLLAAESPKVGEGEIINVGAGRNVSIQGLAEMFGGPIEYGPSRIEAHDSLADTRKAKELLDWEPTIRLEDGIAELKQLFGI